jgi:hypothetical protein
MIGDGDEDADEKAYMLNTKGRSPHQGPSPSRKMIGIDIDNCSPAKQLLFSTFLSFL